MVRGIPLPPGASSATSASPALRRWRRRGLPWLGRSGIQGHRNGLRLGDAPRVIRIAGRGVERESSGRGGRGAGRPCRARGNGMSDIFREIDEELRRDNIAKLWQRYGKYVIGLAVLL